MKKKIIGIITILILSLVLAQPVLADSAVNARLVADHLDLKSSETVEVILSFDFKEIKKGINAYKATLEYDKNIFEEILQSNFECQNNWESLKFNPKTGEIVAIRKAGTKTGEDVVKITFKTKNNVKATKTSIKVKNMTTSEGRKDIFLNDTNIALNIIEEQQEIPTGPSKPVPPSNQGGSNTNIVKPSDALTGNKVNTDLTTNPDNIKDSIENDQNQNEKPSEPIKPTTSPEKTPDTNKEPVKVQKTANRYIGILVFILIQLVLVIGLFIRYKAKNKNLPIKLSALVLSIITIEFVGTICALAYDFSQKGELNGDSEINYADVSLLEMHIIDLKKLESDQLENADMNADGKITITDLTILIQKIEKTLEYYVEITSIEPNEAFPNKNQEVVVKLNADVSYGANIEKIVMNNTEYEITREPNTSLYTIKLSVGPDSGIKKYTISEALLDNNKKVKMDYTFKLDVLKDIPTIENYRVEENKDDSKLILLFNVIDHDDSIEKARVDVYNENQELISQEKVVKGENRIEVSVEEQKEYQANIVLNYNLSATEEDVGHKGIQSYEKQLQLMIDYNFTISNIKSYKEDQETTVFSKEDQVRLVFESSNTTKHIPEVIKVARKEYEVTKENNKFTAKLDALTNLGNQKITIEEVVLSNGKKFELDKSNSITIQVNKRTPAILI